MTIKQYIRKYFEEKVDFDEDTGLFFEQDFWRAWDELRLNMDMGIQWCFEWYYDQPPLTKEREAFIKKAVDNYINNNLKNICTNR